ncbi:MAG: InlB B-repeat-containing protein [Clostridia bacterium]|nr:InlB B-repeat-containing protein [Clostridia bacterium]
MKRSNRLLAFILFVCMVISLVPPLQVARAADIIQRYELDTDGIDVGATYLIVNTGSTGSGNALRFYYNSSLSRDFRNQTITVKDDAGVKYIETGFTNESDCVFTFSAAKVGYITHNNYYIDLSNSRYATSKPGESLNFTSVGDGAYRIYYSSYWSSYYLRYSNSDWARSTTSSTVYLYKLTEYVVGHDVEYNGNGYTAGTLPQNEYYIDSGSEYTVKAPSEGFKMDVGEDTYLFRCWNTKADGSGVEYEPGEKFTVESDVVLYAQWYQQTKHTASFISHYNGVQTDLNDIIGEDKNFYILLDGVEGAYIPLIKRGDGVYSAKVVDNGIYVVYAKNADGKYEEVHGHKIAIYNFDGTTDCFHYSVSYNTNGGVWADGENPGDVIHHSGESAFVTNATPTLKGNLFMGWEDKDGNLYAPGQHLTSAIDEKIELTAKWQETIDITVNVVINHNAVTTGSDNNNKRHELSFTLTREENGVNMPIENKVLDSGYVYDAENNTTTYTVVYTDMPQGTYHVSSAKSSYETVITHEGKSDDDQTIFINHTFAPENFDLYFDVIVKADDEGEKTLMPDKVNVKVSYWGYNEDNVLDWHIITQQDGTKAPISVEIDENGKGVGYYPVWGFWSGTDYAYDYRIEITSYVLPDGSIVPVNSKDKINFYIDGTNLYTAVITIESATENGEEGRIPTYPADSKTDLNGAYVGSGVQIGLPTATIEINSYKVTFDAGEGSVNGSSKVVLNNQYVCPDLDKYVATPSADDKTFICWVDAEGEPVTNMNGQFLNSDVTYYARYNDDAVVSGKVVVDVQYDYNGETATIHEIDRVNKVMVILQKKINDYYNDVDSMIVNIVYNKDENGNVLDGVGEYKFEDVLNDGTEYRVNVFAYNFTTTYDNDADGEYSEEQYVVDIDQFRAEGKVDVELGFAPDSYQQYVRVDASLIEESLRPTAVLVRYYYRDLGDVHNFQIISQHTVSPNGVMVSLDKSTAQGVGYEYVWNWHTNGTPYEYQAEVYLVYGNNLEGAYSEEGIEYSSDRPYFVEYGAVSSYSMQLEQTDNVLEITLVPKEYPIHLDLNLGNDVGTHVYGLEEFMVDDNSSEDKYVFMHTWSFTETFNAYPYREGYVFKGWTSSNEQEVYIKEDGTIYVGNTLAKSVTLTANWEKLEGTDYIIRYLELNTDKVLLGAKSVSGTAVGSTIVAAEYAREIDGYAYAGAYVDGAYHDKTENPAMVISNNPVKNLMVIYYLPDGSDGYTEQVESNLSISKDAVLENDGTYTITFDTYTKDNPITTLIQQNTPLDIVLVLDQSGSLAENDYEYLNALQSALDNFVASVANHGRINGVDHRIAMVGYAGNASDIHSSDPTKPTGGKETDSWINTGVFDSNGEFHLYNVKGFVYTELKNLNSITANGIYYTKVTVDGKEKYLLLTHYDEYRHLINEEQARIASLKGETIYGYVFDDNDVGSFVKLTRNSSGLWLYGDKQLYSGEKFFTYHTDVWTHRDGINAREIHAYGVGSNYTPIDGHSGVYTREETTGTSFQHSIYEDALMPVSVGAMGSGGTNPGLIKATQSLGADGATRASYGMEMANKILAAMPKDDDEGRVRLVVMFTDGEPGYLGFQDGDYYQQGVTEANNAITLAYDTKNVYGAYVYTIGLYESAGVEATSDVSYYMNALSSNYPNAKKMDDIKTTIKYTAATQGTALEANGKFYVKIGSKYYLIDYGYVTVNRRNQWCWYYQNGSTITSISTATYPTVDKNGKVGNYSIFIQSGGFAETSNKGYYATTESSEHLKDYFENVLRDITTKITTEIVLENDTILRDIMNQGLVLTDGTVITVYTQEGNYDLENKKIVWAVDENGQPILEKKVSLEVGKDDDKVITDPESGVSILVYNYGKSNATNPDKADYAPHTVDVTGYNFAEWYISEEHTRGYKMVVTITRVEARDDVEWGRATSTNNEKSGLWLPADASGYRELLLPFDQPTTIFVERAYVLDYGKSFELSGWYFDDEDGKNATAVHVDCDISNGMNYFAPSSPNTENTKDSEYGNLKYGNVSVENGKVTYTPTSTNWGSYDQFYVFGNTWRKTVLAQDANENGNLWNKVTVIPANNIYYEDSFITKSDDVQNGIEGFTFVGEWEIVGESDNNVEIPEHIESAPYGDVHGWTDSLGDDEAFTDGSAHLAGGNGTMGAQATFTFTGTGVDVYTFTNNKSGRVVASLSRITTNPDGTKVSTFVQSISMDNLAMSGDYYSIPTISFSKLTYGTYSVQLVATAAYSVETGMRYEYYIDGIRVYNPLGNATNYMTSLVKDAYELETNAVFTEVRDILLAAKDFNTDLPNGDNGEMGAVFIDWIKKGQGAEDDEIGEGVPTYNVGTFKTYGPKNEAYLSKGQAVVLRVDEANYYFVGMKSLTGEEVIVNVSGIELSEPTSIKFSHTSDLYYRVTPVNGYIVIQNNSTNGALLALTKLRATNLTQPVVNGGILSISSDEAVAMMSDYTAYMIEKQNEEPEVIPPEDLEVIPSLEEQSEANILLANELFNSVRVWLDEE